MEDWDLVYGSDIYLHEGDFDFDDAYAEDINFEYETDTVLSVCASESELSHVYNDGPPIEDPKDDKAFEDVQGDDGDASSLVPSDVNGDVSSLNKFKPVEDVSQTIENGDIECTNVAFVVTEASKEIQPVKETIDVNGFQVFSSQVEMVNYIFKRHPDTALGFRPKNQQIRGAYMNELLNLIDTLCQSPEKLSIDDLSNADETLADLIDVGFKLDWLKMKLNEVSDKKKTVQN